MPALAPVKTAAVSADDFAMKRLAAISSAEFLAPSHFVLHGLKFLWINNGFVRSFYIILWNFAVINTEFFC